MKYLLLSFLIASSVALNAQGDKSQRPSPPAVATQTLANGTHVSIDYGQPSVKGRKIGTDLEPMDGKVWRAGANEATVFEISKPVMIEGQTLPAGKYSLFTISNGDEWTFIFNKIWNQWGAYDYNEGDDALRVKVKASKGNFSEKLTYSIAKDGKVNLAWGDILVGFMIS